MSPEVIKKELVYSKDVVVESLGRVGVDSTYLSAKPWTRRLAFSQKTGTLFVATNQGVSAYAQDALRTGARKSKPGTAEEKFRIRIPSEIQILSVSPSDDFLILCLANSEAMIFKLSRLDSNSTPFQTLQFDAPCRDLIWLDKTSFLYLNSEGKVSRVGLNGVIRPWNLGSEIIAFDVKDGASIWVPSTSPSKIQLPGDQSINVASVFDEKDEQVVVNGVRFIDKERLVASVVIWDSEEKLRKLITLILIQWTGQTEAILTKDLNMPIGEQIEKLDPKLTCPLSILEVGKLHGWLVSFSESLDQPHLLVMEESSEFLQPEDTFPWPIKENCDDNMLIGVAMDFSLSIEIQPNRDLVEMVPAMMIFALADDGNLVVSAMAAEFEDTSSEEAESTDQEGSSEAQIEEQETTGSKIEEQETTGSQIEQQETTGYKIEQQETTGSKIEQQETTETRILARSAAQSTKQVLQVNPVYEQIPCTVQGPSNKVQTDKEESVDRPIPEKKEEQVIRIQDLVQEFESSRLDHLQSFRQVNRMTEMLKLVKLRSVDLFWKVRHEMEKMESDLVDGRIQQQSNYIAQLQDKVIWSLQIMENLKTKVVQSTNGLQIQIDGESTIQALSNEKEQLNKDHQQDLPEQDLESWLDSTMSNWAMNQKQDSTRQVFNPVRHQVVKTVVQESPVFDQSKKAWQELSKEGETPWKELSLISEIPDLKTGQSISHVLTKKKTGQLQWVPHDQIKEQDFSEEEIEDSESENLEICSEDEIARIVEMQKEAEKKEQDLQKHKLTPEQQRQENFYSQILKNSASFQSASPEISIVKLNRQSGCITKQQFLKNLGIDQDPPTVTQEDSKEQDQTIKDPVETTVDVQKTPLSTSPEIEAQSSGFGAVSQSGTQARAPNEGIFQSSASPQPSLQFLNSTVMSINKPTNPDLFKMRK